MEKNNPLKTKEFLFRETTPCPLEIVDSIGCYLIDKTGKKYLRSFLNQSSATKEL